MIEKKHISHFMPKYLIKSFKAPLFEQAICPYELTNNKSINWLILNFGGSSPLKLLWNN